MKFEISRDGALKQLDAFINSELANYSFKRNFDLGPKDKSNVSCLSPYISHRLITEYEVAKTVLAKFPYQKVEKYIQEIFWRVYWKFASIWIFTLNLPWQKGAEFFMKHLYDGDAASNTLSWRWVAGLQTKGKHYVAQSWNISKFTNNKYKNVKLNENASPITDRREYKLSSLEINKEDLESDTLIFFESEQNIETLNLKDYRNIYCVFLNNEKRKIKFDEKVINFKKKIIEDQVNRFSNIKIIDEINFDKYTNEIKDLDVIYPSIGENLSFLKSIKKKKNLNYNFIVRDGDEFCWQFSNKGYFNFKSNIPKIIQKIT